MLCPTQHTRYGILIKGADLYLLCHPKILLISTASQMMSVSRPIFTFSFQLLFMSILSCFYNGIYSTPCPEIEKQALLTFKHSLKNYSDQLSSWNGEVDCCKWDGVSCSNLTGHVHELSLTGNRLSGKLHSSLLSLKHLAYLDLSGNNFNETIPSFVGSFTSLEYLDLSQAGFYGMVPHTIGNLSNLHTLSLASSQMNIDNLEWLSSLSHLEDLNMDFVNLSRATNWGHVINTLPSLVKLSLSSCTLDFTTPFVSVNISTSLTTLDLSSNWQLGSSAVVPSWIFQITNLISLDLSSNYFIGPIPTDSNTTKLVEINLVWNYFNSSIPNWFYSCKHLESVEFRINRLQAKISNHIKNLSSLVTLSLDYNRLSGSIPDSFGNMSVLESLDLSNNQLSGAIPTSLGMLSSLREVKLDHNKLTGNLPGSLGQLSRLQFFFFGDNMLEGIVDRVHFANLTNLVRFDASGNHLTLKVHSKWVPPFNLKALALGSWHVGVSIPPWIQTQKSLRSLDLSNTGISGTIPDWVWKVGGRLDLSHNRLHGTIPSTIPPTIHPYSSHDVDISSNKCNGSLPRITTTVYELDLSDNLFSGDISHFLCNTADKPYEIEFALLSDTELNRSLPDCWMNWTSLKLLNIGNNSFFGIIPNSIGYLSSLQALNLNNNKISGQIPLSVLNCTNFYKIDLSHNALEGNIPRGMGTSLSNLAILILRSNRLSGELSLDICHLHSLRILDLANNQFSGAIPSCIGNLTAMATDKIINKATSVLSYPTGPVVIVYVESANVFTKGRELLYDNNLPLITNVDLSKNNFSGGIPKELTRLVELKSLNLSQNHLIGSIPDNIGDMKNLESLDLSRNSLSGVIPNTFTALSFLSHLNLSYNNLTGRIPDTTQLQGQDPSSFMGNNLCGPPLTNNCSSPNIPVQGKEGSQGSISEVQWLYVIMSLGYSIGFSAACTALVLKKSWRVALFGFVEEGWDEIYVYLYIKWRRLARRSS